jgi:hypothetical protein
VEGPVVTVGSVTVSSVALGSARTRVFGAANDDFTKSLFMKKSVSKDANEESVIELGAFVNLFFMVMLL